MGHLILCEGFWKRPNMGDKDVAQPLAKDYAGAYEYRCTQVGNVSIDLPGMSYR